MKPDLRRTGRTTRLVLDAIEIAAKENAVYIVTANQREVERFEKLLGLERMQRLGIKVETPETLGGWSWERMRVEGAHDNCAFLVDHFAIESRFAAMLRELHRYDQ